MKSTNQDKIMSISNVIQRFGSGQISYEEMWQIINNQISSQRIIPPYIDSNNIDLSTTKPQV